MYLYETVLHSPKFNINTVQIEGLLSFGRIKDLTSFWNQIFNERCVFQDVLLADDSSKAKIVFWIQLFIKTHCHKTYCHACIFQGYWKVISIKVEKKC